MTNTLKYIVAVVSGILLGFLCFYLGRSSVSVPAQQQPLVGDVSHQGGINVSQDGLGYGGYESTSSVTAAYTLSASELQSYGYIRFATIGTSGTTLALPASTSLISFLSVPGQRYSLFLDNATTTTQNLTIVGNTGMLLALSGTTTANLYGSATGASSTAQVEFIRKQNGDFIARFSSAH